MGRTTTLVLPDWFSDVPRKDCAIEPRAQSAWFVDYSGELLYRPQSVQPPNGRRRRRADGSLRSSRSSGSLGSLGSPASNTASGEFRPLTSTANLVMPGGESPDCTVDLIHRNSPGGFPDVDDGSFFQWAGLSWSTNSGSPSAYPKSRRFGRKESFRHLISR